MTERGLTQEELALLGHSELVAEEPGEPDVDFDLPVGFRERLALGDLSW
jgi:hypothetical protein